MMTRIAVLCWTAGLVMALLPGTVLAQAPPPQPSAEAMIATWPEVPRNVANQMIAKYGQPEGVTPSRLIWQNRGPWREIIVYREEIPHNFPKPHTDLLEQTINYQVPVEMFDDLAAYDGSVIAERTAGTLAARCDMEAANFLALNLANDIVTGKKTVQEARQAYGEAIQALMRGEKPPYTQGLQFQVVTVQATRDPDVAII